MGVAANMVLSLCLPTARARHRWHRGQPRRRPAALRTTERTHPPPTTEDISLLESADVRIVQTKVRGGGGGWCLDRRRRIRAGASNGGIVKERGADRLARCRPSLTRRTSKRRPSSPSTPSGRGQATSKRRALDTGLAPRSLCTGGQNSGRSVGVRANSRATGRGLGKVRFTRRDSRIDRPTFQLHQRAQARVFLREREGWGPAVDGSEAKGLPLLAAGFQFCRRFWQSSLAR